MLEYNIKHRVVVMVCCVLSVGIKFKQICPFIKLRVFSYPKYHRNLTKLAKFAICRVCVCSGCWTLLFFVDLFLIEKTRVKSLSFGKVDEVERYIIIRAYNRL